MFKAFMGKEATGLSQLEFLLQFEIDFLDMFEKLFTSCS